MHSSQRSRRRRRPRLQALSRSAATRGRATRSRWGERHWAPSASSRAQTRRSSSPSTTFSGLIHHPRAPWPSQCAVSVIFQSASRSPFVGAMTIRWEYHRLSPSGASACGWQGSVSAPRAISSERGSLRRSRGAVCCAFTSDPAGIRCMPSSWLGPMPTSSRQRCATSCTAGSTRRSPLSQPSSYSP